MAPLLAGFMITAAVMLALLAAGCSSGPAQPLEDAAYKQYEQSHFGFFRAFKSYPFVDELGVHWERPHPGPFIWGAIEKQPGVLDWSDVDKYVQDAQNNNIQTVATIWPYAGWDQQQCHEPLPDNERLLFRPDLGNYRGKPCDARAYQDFVKALVDRYDGDGSNDMPGLKYPIKYWEVDNEPDIAGGSLFFRGDPQTGDYLELLQETHDAIREIDPGAKVLNGGIAYLNPQDRPFWQDILSGPGANDIDILTIHGVEQGKDLQLPLLTDLMNETDVTRPVWVTEIQFAHSQRVPPNQVSGQVQPSPIQDLNQDQWSMVIVQSFVEAFGRGAQKLFYIGLDNGTPTEQTSLLVSCQAAPGAGRDDPFDPATCVRQKPFYAFKTLVDKVDYFDSAQQLADGQYRFSVGGRRVYVLWGSQPLPAEITGPVTVTDIYGQQHQDMAQNIHLTDAPVYVEPGAGQVQD